MVRDRDDQHLYPRIELDISLNDRQMDLVKKGYDVAGCVARLDGSSLVGRRFASTQCACVRRQLYKRHAPFTLRSDLIEHRVIAHSNFSSGNEWRFNGPDGEYSDGFTWWSGATVSLDRAGDLRGASNPQTPGIE
jgi:DNA-binding transcriptional LysR family regulator